MNEKKRQTLARKMKNPLATASLIESWIDESERRTWFLFEASRSGNPRAS
jgi:hypothetical protein